MYGPLTAKQGVYQVAIGVCLLLCLCVFLVDDQQSSVKSVASFYSGDTDQVPFGFSQNGVYPATQLPAGVAVSGSWQGRDGNLGVFTSQPFATSGWIGFWLCGYPLSAGNAVHVDRLADGSSIRLGVPRDPQLRCHYQSWQVPLDFRATPLQIRVVDGSTNSWVAIGDVNPTANPAEADHIEGNIWTAVVGMLSLWILLLLPGIAFALVRPGANLSLVYLLLSNIWIDGMLALCTLITVFFLPLLAHVLWFLVFGATLIALVHRRDRLLRWIRGPSFRAYCLVATLPLLVAIFAHSLCFLYGGETTPLATAATRFVAWAADNELPFQLAQRMRHYQPLSPLMGGQASDRPALQSGFVLLLSPWVDSQYAYQLLATLLQSMCLLGLYVFLWGLRIPHQGRVFATVLVGSSGFYLMNTVYVWPKMIAPTFVFAALGILCRYHHRHTWAHAAGGGSLLGLALFTHGGSLFAVLGIGLSLLIFRICRITFLVQLAAWTVLTFSPWILFVQLVDPPGDMLVKWHLGGVLNDTSRSAFRTIFDSYLQLPLSTIVRAKVRNFGDLVGNWSGFIEGISVGREFLVQRWLDGQFFTLVPAVLPAALALFALPWLPPAAKSAVTKGLSIVTLTTVVWCLMMFGIFVNPDYIALEPMAVLHHGSYFVPVALMALSAAALARLPAPIPLLGVILQMICSTVPYLLMPSGAAKIGTLLPTAFAQPNYLLLALLMLGLFMWIALKPLPTLTRKETLKSTYRSPKDAFPSRGSSCSAI